MRKTFPTKKAWEQNNQTDYETQTTRGEVNERD